MTRYVRHCISGAVEVAVGICESCKPLVVIDPEDRKAVDRLRGSWVLARKRGASVADGLQAALREYANPKPEVEQPTNVGALVEATFATALDRDKGRTLWSLAEDGSWRCLTDGRTSTGTGWPFLTDVKVIWDGVPA